VVKPTGQHPMGKPVHRTKKPVRAKKAAAAAVA